MKKLFTYAVLFHKHVKNEKGEAVYQDSEMIIEPKTVLAASEKEVVFKATREIDEEYSKSPDHVEIIVKAF